MIMKSTQTNQPTNQISSKQTVKKLTNKCVIVGRPSWIKTNLVWNCDNMFTTSSFGSFEQSSKGAMPSRIRSTMKTRWKLSTESPTPALIASSSTGPHPMQRWWFLRQKASCTTPYRPTVETQRQSSPYSKCGSKLSRVPTILCTVLGSEKNARRRTAPKAFADQIISHCQMFPGVFRKQSAFALRSLN